MVLALIATIPHSLPMQTKHIQLQNSRTTNVMWICVKRSHKSHTHTHRKLNGKHNTHRPTLTHTEHVHTVCQHMCICVFIKWWNELFAVGLRMELHCGVAGGFLGMIGRLRPVERPIWPHFNSDGSADWFPVAESPGGWSHTHTHTYSRCVHVWGTSDCVHILYVHTILVNVHMHVQVETHPKMAVVAGDKERVVKSERKRN